MVAMTSPTWAAVRIWASADVRRRWRSWAVLGLLGGVTIGLAAAGVAGARRTASAVPNAERALHVADAGVLANSPAFGDRQRAAIAALPYVTATYPFEVAFALEVPSDPPLGTTTLVPTTDAAARNLIGVLVAGRMPDPARADEVVVDQNARRRFGLGIGSTMEVAQSISPQDLASAPPGLLAKGVNPNFHQKLRVVGIQKSLSSDSGWVPSSGFYAQYGRRMPGFVNEFVTMRGGQADLARLTADVSRIAGHPVNVESTQDLDGLRKAKDVTGVEREGLLLFALAVVIGGGVLVGQALVRAVTAGAADLPTWQAMGAETSTVVPALVLPAFITAGVAAATSVVAAIALSSRFPLGLARVYDLDVGVHADWLVLLGAAAAVTVGVVLTAVSAALWRTTRGASARERPGASGRWSARVGFPPALDVGFRLAVEPGRGRTAVPVRSALVGAIVGVLGVVGCLTFRSGLDAAVASPARSGVVWDYVLASGEGRVAPKDLTTITRDADVAAALEASWARAVPVNGVATPTFGTKALKSTMDLVVLSGRAPAARDEIAFAPTTMKSLHLHVGDVATVGRNARVHVVGVALLPSTSHTDYDQSGWMTSTGLASAMPPLAQQTPDDIEDYVGIRWRSGTDVVAAAHRVRAIGEPGTYDVEPATRPTSVIDLGKLRSLPFALGIFFGLLAAATVAHALVTTVRRRRRDLAVLRSLGFTRRQSRLAIAWQATLLAFGGVVVGVPLGVLFGQRSWRALANSFPLVYASPFAVVAVLIAVPVALVIANLLAAGPAHAATRISPARALRAE
jgi:hypothetical protein